MTTTQVIRQHESVVNNLPRSCVESRTNRDDLFYNEDLMHSHCEWLWQNVVVTFFKNSHNFKIEKLLNSIAPLPAILF